ncbi:hypothetical protein SNE40_011947 [Patella caerulea]|uniref:G-protein coupled receptors family 1 profile domain-containing protein n=1 Tax=Patella caerulea TaxID=87958 RepID=A0AAN8JTA4_PATCE
MSNYTVDAPAFVFPIGTTVIIGVISSLLALFTAGSNLLVLITFAKNESLRVFNDYFILNLACADFIIGFICIPPYIPYLLTGVWSAGRAFCKLWLVLDYVTPAASTLCMCVISIDRYCLVVYPLVYKARQNRKVHLMMMLIPWIITFLVYCPAIVLWEIVSGVDDLPETVCRIPFYNNLPYLMLGAFVEFVIPLFIIATLNVIIFLNIRRRAKVGTMGSIKPQVATITLPSGSSMPTLAVNQNIRPTPSKPIQREVSRDRKAAKALFILVFCFVVCWMPFEVMSMLSSVWPSAINPVLFEVGFWILWCNSALNPILYPFLHPRMRKAFLKLIRSNCSCK